MLRFAARYGPVCRFANPAALGGAAGWVFVTSPDDIEHVCGAAARNYQERCECPALAVGWEAGAWERVRGAAGSPDICTSFTPAPPACFYPVPPFCAPKGGSL